MNTTQAWIGADPGGDGNFGVAVLTSDGSCTTGAVDHADAALQWVKQKLGGTSPQCAGIDAPLWWSSGPSGLRDADRRIRQQYPKRLHHRNVQATNCLWGAVLIQGVLFAHLLIKHFPNIGLTETHPKAVLRGWGPEQWDRLNADIRADVALRKGPEHRRDAMVSAIAAREGSLGRWPEDLFRDLPPSERNPSSTWLRDLHYYWPESLPLPVVQR